MGDGLSLGINPNTVRSINYSNFIKKYLVSKGKEVLHYDYSKTNFSISELTNDIIYLKDKELKRYLQTSDLVIVFIGEQEIREKIPIKEIEEDMKNLISEIKRYNNNICILGHYYLNQENNPKIKEINNVYRNIAKENNLIFINLENLSYKNLINYYPTQKGYEQISKLIIKAIHLKGN